MLFSYLKHYGKKGYTLWMMITILWKIEVRAREKKGTGYGKYGYDLWKIGVRATENMGTR